MKNYQIEILNTELSTRNVDAIIRANNVDEAIDKYVSRMNEDSSFELRKRDNNGSFLIKGNYDNTFVCSIFTGYIL